MDEMQKTKRMFGTNGVRGVTGETMTPVLVYKIGAALGSMVGTSHRQGHEDVSGL